MKRLILILYPFKFRIFDWYRFEMDNIIRDNNVVIFELINHLYPHFQNAYAYEKITKKNIRRINNLSEFEELLYNYKKKYNKKNILILNFIKNDSFKSLLINLKIKKSELKVVEFFNPGISNFDHSIMALKEGIHKKILYLFLRKRETIQKIKSKILTFLEKIFKLKPDFILVSGVKCKKKILSKYKDKNVKFIKGNSWDYSKILKDKNIKRKNKNFVVYLDAPGPKFLSDSHLNKERMAETVEHTYPTLKSFFSFVEKKNKTQVIIAPHPRTKIKDRSSLFGKRRVISNQTHELIKNSKFVITRNSTAITYALFYNKPIIMFYTSQMFNTYAYRSALPIAKSLNINLININNLKEINFIKLLKFSKKKYKNYLFNYCTFKDVNKPNNIIISDLFDKF